MDISFDFENRAGDRIKIALSEYDRDNKEIFSTDPSILNLSIFNISLERIEKKSKYLNPFLLCSLCDMLYKFLEENSNSILTYICDPKREVERSHEELTPQEYRNNLFSKLFDYFTYSNNITNYIDELIYVKDPINRNNDTFIHFIYNVKHKKQIEIISKLIMGK